MDELLDRAREGQSAAVGRLITLLERGELGTSALASCASDRAASHVVGFTGAPGVGKSAALSALTQQWRSLGRRVAILAIDPSSHISGGAFLGDRARMTAHALDQGVYIRSLAARGRLGGLAEVVPAATEVLAWAGYEMVAVETVGVGQSETEVSAVVDTTCVLLAPGMGDGLQAVKAGIMEIGDIFVVTKSDLGGAADVMRTLRSAVATRRPDGWRPAVVQISAQDGTGLTDLVEALDEHRRFVGAEDRQQEKAFAYARSALLRATWDMLLLDLESQLGPFIDELVATVVRHDQLTRDAAAQLVSRWRS